MYQVVFLTSSETGGDRSTRGWFIMRTPLP
jgi:hypothetical protein